MAKKKTEKQQKTKKGLPKYVLIFGGIILMLILGLILIRLFFSNRFYPYIYIGENNVSSLTKADAAQLIDNNLQNKLKKPLIFTGTNGNDTKIEIDLSKIIDKIDTETQINRGFEYGHNKFYRSRVNLSLTPKFNQEFDLQIARINQEVKKDPIDSEIKIADDQINVTPSQNGVEIDDQAVKQIITDYLNSNNETTTHQLPLKEIPPSLSYQSALNLKKTLDQVKLEPIRLTFEDRVWLLDLQQVINLIDIQNSKPSLAKGEISKNSFNIASFNIGGNSTTDAQILLGEEKIKDYLKGIAGEIDQPLKEPLFSFDGTRVTEFQPPQEGRTLNIDKAAVLIADNLLNPMKKVIELPVNTIEPKNKLSNEMGIKELVGEGSSNFAGSIPNRIYNVGLAASKINGILIAPNQEFSFVNTIGDITAATGYKQAYVIKSGRTVLDDGGGVCQVSTTLFRAVLNSGLPITKRVAHAYRVGYYEQGYPPGLDATIFYPSVDFKFKNDTGHYILIQAQVSGTRIDVNLYGTSDGRIAEVSRPVITSTSPAPPELRQDDPTLPKGTVKQVDFAASGATVVFNRKVTRGGETLINESFKSVYRPWQAVFLVGTGG